MRKEKKGSEMRALKIQRGRELNSLSLIEGEIQCFRLKFLMFPFYDRRIELHPNKMMYYKLKGVLISRTNKMKLLLTILSIDLDQKALYDNFNAQ
jgi:hypothetical protein